jgi:hypothetical protein
VEIAIAGEGEIEIRFIDQQGRTLIQERVAVSGSPTVEARRIIALSADTAGGRVPLAPVLVRQGNPEQRVTFDGETPSRFTRRRCEEIGCTADVAADAERGCAPPPAQRGGAGVLSDNEALARVIRAAVRGEEEQGE